ncbi:MAG: hypothetical protein KGI26_07435 [Thaumarchaeota archaeon]|nr:hypothetical protein [Nitrososphaerota archaeon]
MCTVTAEVLRTKLGQLLEQEGQPCSYCIAVFMMMAGGEALPPKDRTAYSHHLVWEHGAKPYFIVP